MHQTVELLFFFPVFCACTVSSKRSFHGLSLRPGKHWDRILNGDTPVSIHMLTINLSLIILRFEALTLNTGK